MKITIEIEDSVYNTLTEYFKPYGHTLELLVARVLTQVVVLMATDPDVLAAIYEKSSEVPGYPNLLEALQKPAPEEE